MQLLNVPFVILSFYGMRTKGDFASNSKLYKTYAIVISLMMLLFIMAQTVTLINCKKLEEFTEVFFLYITMSACFFKIIHLQFKQNNIKIIFQMLNNFSRIQKSSQELKIEEHFDFINR